MNRSKIMSNPLYQDDFTFTTDTIHQIISNTLHYYSKLEQSLLPEKKTFFQLLEYLVTTITTNTIDSSTYYLEPLVLC